MNASIPLNKSPFWAYGTCYSLIALSLTSHAITLDRYPAPFWDEAVFYSPAVNYVEGRGLKSNMATDAPHPEITWAFHAPFFPRAEVMTFHLLGVSQFSSRILPYAAAHIGIALLCQSLLRAGLYRCALCFVIAWIGDCSMTWIVWARPEGMCLFCLAGGFASVIWSIRTGCFLSFYITGLFLGAAIGFHPVTILFAGVTGVVILAKRKGRDVLAYTGGALTAAIMFLLCWLPDVSASTEQFLWLLHKTEKHSLMSAWAAALSKMEWSRYWLIGLIVITVATATLLIASLRKGGSKQNYNIGYRVGAWAVLFGACALGAFLIIAGSKFNPYYCVHFTIWPVIGLTALWEGGYFARVSVSWKAVTAGLLVCSWLPSLAWNARRVIVPIRDFGSLDRTQWERTLAQIIPKDARVTGSAEFFILTRKCEFTFVPIPFYSEALIPADNWVLLEDYDYRTGRRIDHNALAERTIAAKGAVCPLARGVDRMEFVLYRPLNLVEQKGEDGK